MSDLQTRDARHIWHPYTQMKTAPPPIPIVRGEGCLLYTEDGRALIDAISSWWVNLHGHGHPLIADYIARQARELEHVIFSGFTHSPAVDLAPGLVAVVTNHPARLMAGWQDHLAAHPGAELPADSTWEVLAASPRSDGPDATDDLEFKPRTQLTKI